MFIEIFSAIVVGMVLGIVTGLIPGVHVNLVVTVLLSITPVLTTRVSLLAIAIIILSTAITHSFLDIIPSIFLSVPNQETLAILLPGQKLLLEGQGYEACKLATVGSLLALLFGIAIIPLLYMIVPFIYDKINPYIAFLLIAVTAFMIIKENKRNEIFWALIIFLLAGILGYTALQLNEKHILLPLLSGLFGISGILIAIKDFQTIPAQIISEFEELEFPTLSATLLGSTVAAWIASLLPGLGTAQSVVLSRTVFSQEDIPPQLVFAGATNTMAMLFSLVTFINLNKARNGAIVGMRELLQTINLHQFIFFLLIALLVGAVATPLTIFMAKFAAEKMNDVNYHTIGKLIIAFIIILTILLTGWKGVLVLIISTALGLLPNLLGIKKSHLMGCLVFPVIIFLL